MEYKIIGAANLDRLQRHVREHIMRGWLPLGGMSMMSFGDYGNKPVYYQTMTRIESKNKEGE